MAFLKNTARQIWNKYGKEVSTHMFLFPSRRSMLYFKRAITEVAGQSLWMPECLTLEQWILDHSDYVLADTLTCTYNLYLSAQKVGFTKTYFEEFYPLARIILSDFEDVDMALVNPGIMWKHTSAWQNLAEKEGPPDIWGEMSESSLKQQWILNWNMLDGLYKDFVTRMKRQKIASRGLIYRHSIGELGNAQFDQFSKIHVVGFSHLTKAEIEVLEYIKSENPTLFYWNVLPEFNNRAIDAGENVTKWANYFGQELTDGNASKPEVEIISTSGMIPQIKTVSQLLSGASVSEDKMAILLPNPSLIEVLLTSFPDNRSKVNISLGYPLIYSTARSLLVWMLSLWESMDENEGRISRYELERIVSHLYVATYMSANNIRMTDSDRLYYSSSELTDEHQELSQIYTPLSSPDEAVDRMIVILEKLTPYQPEVFHREILRYVVGRLVRLRDVLSGLPNISLVFLKRILAEVMQTTSVPFRGEPMEGVQVLGVQEVQNLSFETLIIPGMNEEVLPSGRLQSLIPFSLRQHYGLDDLSDMHTIQSYYIWSAMLQARRVYLLHSQGDDMLGAKGLSRYIFQLKYGIKDITPTERYLDLALSGFDQQPKQILMNKTDEKLLHDYLKHNGLSPTALMSYITCPFQFFLRYVKRIKEDDVPQAGLDYGQMGTVIHNVMYDLYKPFIGKEISMDDIEGINSGVVKAVQVRYQELYPHDAPESLVHGQHWLEQEIIIRAARRFLEYDKGVKGLTICLLEEELEQYISTEYIEDVKVFGKIDRLDQKQQIYRIIDYKTGTSNLNSKFDLRKLWEKRNPAHNWQVLFYAYLLKDRLGSVPFEAGHYTLKDRNLYVPMITKKNTVHSSVELAQFEGILKEIIDEMVNPAIPFTQTDTKLNCKHCVFNTFCERQGA